MKKPAKSFLFHILLTLLTAVLWMLCFPPFGTSAFAFIAFVPWFLGLKNMRGWEIFLSSLIISGFLSFGNLGWISHLHIGGFGVIVLYFWLITAMLGFIVRFAHTRKKFLALIIVVSSFVGIEFLRTYLLLPMTFPWLHLGLSQVNFTLFAQIADIGGVFLISGVLISINWAFARFILDIKTGFKPKILIAPVCVLLIFVASLIYGSSRISQIEAETVEGPGVSLVQPNFTFPRRPGQNNEQALFDLTRIAAKKSEIVVVPETALNSHSFEIFNKEKPELSCYGRSWFNDVQFPAKESKMQYLIGGSTLTTDEENPRLNNLKFKRNAGLLISKDGEVLDDYAKIGLVPIGEYVPFAGKFSDAWKILGPVFLGVVFLFIIFLLLTKKRLRLRFNIKVRIIIWVFVFTGLYMAFFVTLSSYLKGLIISGFQSAGFGDDYIPNDKPGEKYTKFKIELDVAGENSETPQKYTFATPICYEIGYPQIVRKLASSDGENVDFVLNLSNDNFYRKSAELDQMLQIAQFRSIETRKAIARCTTTGISAFISPTGKILKIVEVNGEKKEVAGILTDRIQVFKGQSLYVQLGEWFAILCFGLFLLTFVYWWWTKN